MKKSAANFNKIFKAEEEEEIPLDPDCKFTGVARSMICFKHMNVYNNFKIVTLYIVDGVVMKKELSDPYANFEADLKIFKATQASSDNLNRNWKDGLAFQK